MKFILPIIALVMAFIAGCSSSEPVASSAPTTREQFVSAASALVSEDVSSMSANALDRVLEGITEKYNGLPTTDRAKAIADVLLLARKEDKLEALFEDFVYPALKSEANIPTQADGVRSAQYRINQLLEHKDGDAGVPLVVKARFVAAALRGRFETGIWPVDLAADDSE